MRNLALVSVVVLGVLGGPAHAEHDRTARADEARAAARATASRVASLAGAVPITGTTPRSPATANLTRLERERLLETSPATSHPEAARLDGRGTPTLERYLTSGDISSQVAPYLPDIERCYLDATGDLQRTAQLDLMFVIGRGGDIVSLDIAAPEVAVRKVLKIARCIRGAVESLRFPERRNGTTAILPYLFQRTEAPSAGPQRSCWNPKGCRS